MLDLGFLMCLPDLENGRLFSMRARACGCFESQPCPAPYNPSVDFSFLALTLHNLLPPLWPLSLSIHQGL